VRERPTIGVTKPARGDNLAFLCICIAVWLSGGRPLRLTARQPRSGRKLAGLILGGGADVFPGLYAFAPKRGYRYDRTRDEMEIEWARRARDSKIPVLGICRGAQLMNVISDGTLHLEVSDAYEVDYPSTVLGHILYRKTILIEQGSHLARAIGAATARVNSMHKQAIDRLGADLIVTARERNGVVQAIEDASRRFYLGVQFHPEFLIYRARFRRIFQRFIEAAREAPTAIAA
jgi:putative glutamine amidotransferase